ncbi:MAG: hypothetical protein ACOVLE_05515, partial [Pirellula staleyi]
HSGRNRWEWELGMGRIAVSEGLCSGDTEVRHPSPSDSARFLPEARNEVAISSIGPRLCG